MTSRIVAVRTLFHGDAPCKASFANDAGAFVLDNAEEWSSRWSAMTDAAWPAPALPAVDWDTETVLVLGLGRRPTGAYQVTIETVTADDRGLRITTREIRPGGAALDIITYPVHAVALTLRDIGDEILITQHIAVSTP